MSKYPSELVDAAKSGRLAVFVGSGISRAADLPSWDALLKRMIDEVAKIPGIQKDAVKQYRKLSKDKTKYLSLASILRRELGPKFAAIITEVFADPTTEPARAHELIMSLPSRIFITTNYDGLLEGAYSRLHKGRLSISTLTYDNVSQLASCLIRKQPFVLKAHGDARTEPEKIVLEEKDYRQLVHVQPGYQSFLQTVFTTNHLLFLGTSLEDFDLKLLLGFLFTAYHGHPPLHFALMHESSNLPVEANALFNDFNIRIIPYSDSDYSKGVVNWLRGLHKAIK